MSGLVLACAFTVSNTPGAGFLEKVYENSLARELRKQGLKVQQQFSINVQYDGVLVGEYVAGLLVNEALLLELKATKGLDAIHEAQCLNYLKATALKTCLLMNFGTPRMQIRRLSL